MIEQNDVPINMVLFHCGATQVLIEQSFISSLLADTHQLPIQLINENLNIYPLNDSLKKTKRLLILNKGAEKFALAVDEPIEFKVLSSKKISLLPDLIKSGQCLPYLKAIAILDQGIGLIIDPLSIPDHDRLLDGFP